MEDNQTNSNRLGDCSCQSPDLQLGRGQGGMVVSPARLKSRIFWMSNMWGVVFTLLVMLKYVDPSSYVGLMLTVFASFTFKNIAELKS